MAFTVPALLTIASAMPAHTEKRANRVRQPVYFEAKPAYTIWPSRFLIFIRTLPPRLRAPVLTV
jgi:hypothetical protein